MARVRTAVLISGRGSNLQSLLDAARDTRYPAEIVLVVSNNPAAAGLDRARAAAVPAVVIDHRDHAERADFETALQAVLDRHRVELVCLAGFMRLLTADFVARWTDRMINIHPSLLPDFKGLDTHRRVLEAGVAETGCTVHFVRPDMDSGPIILQLPVPVLPTDDESALAARVLAQEHQAYPRALKALAEGRLRVVGNRVEADGEI